MDGVFAHGYVTGELHSGMAPTTAFRGEKQTKTEKKAGGCCASCTKVPTGIKIYYFVAHKKVGN